MNLRKGILRIALLAIWFLLWAAFAFAIFQVLGSTFTFDNIFLCMTMFVAGFYLMPVLIILWVNSLRTPMEQSWDMVDLSSKVVYLVSIITGMTGLATYAYIIPSESHLAPYVGSFALPFTLIFGSYILIRWIVEGFRDTGKSNGTG